MSYSTSMSARFLLGTVCACSLISLGLGILARSIILENTISSIVDEISNLGNMHGPMGDFLPTPTVSIDKIVPQTIYTTMNFDTRSSVVSSQWLDNGATPRPQLSGEAPVNSKLTPINNYTDYEYDADEEEHLPAGQHLLIDIDGVDSSFLNSEKQLATAMLQMVDNSGLTLLSYHCHGLQPSGVTCVGVLLESHVSFHTWPTEGVITLDLFTCGSTSLLKHLQLVQNLFAIPRRGVQNPETPRVLWAYKRRGFKEQKNNAGFRDTFAYPLGIHGIEQKKEITSVTTDQGKHGWVYDMQRSIKGTQHSNDPSRFFYLDGVLKASSESGSESYESFVQPSMFAHNDPKRILVFGTTTGATVKEILKHKSVEQISLVGVDESLMTFAKETLRAWNDCSDIVRINESCLDDTRVSASYENPFMWLHNYHASSLEKASSSFDVIIVDFFDLDEEVASDILNRNLSFLSGLKRILNDGGILVFNAGSDFRAVDSKTTAHSTSREVSTVQSTLSKSLAELGFIHVKQYNDNLAAYPNPKAFVVAFSDDDTAKNWNRNEAQINRIIRDRTLSTKSGDTLFKLFDGSTMVSYSRFEQYVDNCNTHPDPRWCDINRQLMVAKASLNQLPQEMRSFDTCKETPNTSDSNASCNGLAHCNRNQPSDGSRWSTNNRINRSQFIGIYESSQSHRV